MGLGKVLHISRVVAASAIFLFSIFLYADDKSLLTGALIKELELISEVLNSSSSSSMELQERNKSIQSTLHSLRSQGIALGELPTLLRFIDESWMYVQEKLEGIPIAKPLKTLRFNKKHKYDQQFILGHYSQNIVALADLGHRFYRTSSNKFKDLDTLLDKSAKWDIRRVGPKIIESLETDEKWLHVFGHGRYIGVERYLRTPFGGYGLSVEDFVRHLNKWNALENKKAIIVYSCSEASENGFAKGLSEAIGLPVIAITGKLNISQRGDVLRGNFIVNIFGNPHQSMPWKVYLPENHFVSPFTMQEVNEVLQRLNSMHLVFESQSKQSNRCLETLLPTG